MSREKGIGWLEVKKKRRRVALDLIALYNREKHMAVFPEDFKRVDMLANAVDFMRKTEHNYDWLRAGNICPICGSKHITSCKIDPCCFDDANPDDFSDSKIVHLIVFHCCDCGFLNFFNPYDSPKSPW